MSLASNLALEYTLLLSASATSTHPRQDNWNVQRQTMEFKVILLGLTATMSVLALFFGTKNGFYDTDKYHGNGSAH